MSKQLYEEALADAKRLKEVAEDNAKRALVEAVVPRIRDLIEKELLREYDESTDLETEVHGYPGSPEAEGDLLTDEDALFHTHVGFPGTASGMFSPAEPRDVDAFDVGALHVDDAGAPVEPPLFGAEVKDDEYELDAASLDVLRPLASTVKVKKFNSDMNWMGEQIEAIKLMSKHAEPIDESKQVQRMISKVENMYAYVQESVVDPAKKNAYEQKLENYFKELTKLQENNKMSNRFNKLMNEGDVTLKLTGLPDDLDLDSIGVDLISDEGGEEEGEEEEMDLGGDEDEGGEEEMDFGADEGEEEEGEEEETKAESLRLRDNVIVEIDEGMLRREISRMKTLREEKVPSTKGAGPGDLNDFGGGDDEGDPFLDIELSESLAEETNELYEDDRTEEMYQADDNEDKHEGNKKVPSYRAAHPSEQPNRQANLPEALRRELRIQTEVKKKATDAKKKKDEAKHKAEQKMKEARKAKTKAEQAKKQKEAASCGKQARQMKEAYDFYVGKFQESVQRAKEIKRAINESALRESAHNGTSARSARESENLRNKLAETNLFNAKLVYTNRLLQNESLSKKQKAEIIERLDEASNIREVKLVYESLSKTLAGTSRPLSESTERNVIGSASRTTRPASTNLNEGFETDRWARLAGINK